MVVSRGVVGLIVWTLVVACGGVCESSYVLLSVVGDYGLVECCDVFFCFVFLYLFTRFLVVGPSKELALKITEGCLFTSFTCGLTSWA